MIMNHSNKNVYAFDECSVLKLCEIDIPAAFNKFFDKTKIFPKNHAILKRFIELLDSNKCMKCIFVPGNFEINVKKVMNELLKEYNIQMFCVLKMEIIKQLQEFIQSVHYDFFQINKDEKIASVLLVFVENQKTLRKPDSIPSDDDLKIIAGYNNFSCTGGKYLISEDEHFWGYADVILKHFDIIVIKEWECWSKYL